MARECTKAWDPQVSVSAMENPSKLTASSDRVMAGASPTVPHYVSVCSASGPDLKY